MKSQILNAIFNAVGYRSLFVSIEQTEWVPTGSKNEEYNFICNGFNVSVDRETETR